MVRMGTCVRAGSSPQGFLMRVEGRRGEGRESKVVPRLGPSN
jgi:hypothetical protein